MKNSSKLKRYWPLFCFTLIAAFSALMITYGTSSGFFAWMHFFMGLFLCQFSMLKMFNISTFVEGFQKYDILTQIFKPYGYIYPFIELSLGLLYLSLYYSIIAYISTIVIMTVSAGGVIKALRKGLDVRCACMGTALDVPLSTVTLTEDIAMILMAIAMLVMKH